MMCEVDLQKKTDSFTSIISERQSNALKTPGENQFMTLVRAATSILDKQNVAKSSPNRTDVVKASPPVRTVHEESNAILNTESGSSSGPSTIRINTSCCVNESTNEFTLNHGDNRKRRQSFPEQLMSVLDDERNSNVLTWMPNGAAFTIVNPKLFTSVLMPKIFKIQNMSSFVRKLGRWGFHRVHEKETRNSDIFKHQSFQRGKWELCSKIKCAGRQTSCGKNFNTESPRQVSATSSAVKSLEVKGHKQNTEKMDLKDGNKTPMETKDPRHSSSSFVDPPSRLRVSNDQINSFSLGPAHKPPAQKQQRMQDQQYQNEVLQKRQPYSLQSLVFSPLSNLRPTGVASEILTAAFESLTYDDERIIPDLRRARFVYPSYNPFHGVPTNNLHEQTIKSIQLSQKGTTPAQPLSRWMTAVSDAQQHQQFFN